MVKKFTRKQLMEQIEFNAEDTKVILDYQERLPILIEDDESNEFSVNARDLWKQLSEPQGQFNKWVERKFKPYGFIENVDFSAVGQFCPTANGGYTISKEYMLSVDMAKQLSMIDKKENGFLTRRYFILMEKAVKKNINWEGIRNPLKEGYKVMQSALDAHLTRTVHRHADDWDYSFEANALNIIATGFKAQDIKLYLGCQDKLTRDSLNNTYNNYLLKLQEQNTIFLGMDIGKENRYMMLKQAFDVLFPDSVPLICNESITTIINNKNKFINEARKKYMV